MARLVTLRDALEFTIKDKELHTKVYIKGSEKQETIMPYTILA